MRLEQVINNLLVNAIKYTPQGRRIIVAVERIGDEAVLSVGDEGIGMLPDLTARVFELFVQGKRALDRAGGGLGIGLTLVKRLVELHGSIVTAYSASADLGSEFVARFPAVERPVLAEQTHPPAESAAREILVIDDGIAQLVPEHGEELVLRAARALGGGERVGDLLDLAHLATGERRGRRALGTEARPVAQRAHRPVDGARDDDRREHARDDRDQHGDRIRDARLPCGGDRGGVRQRDRDGPGAVAKARG